jgi:hypothetical protein
MDRTEDTMLSEKARHKNTGTSCVEAKKCKLENETVIPRDGEGCGWAMWKKGGWI